MLASPSKRTPAFAEHATQRSALYRAIQFVLRVLLFVLTDFEVIGREHIPSSGPFLIAPNHVSMVDLAVAMVAIPYRVAVFAADKHRQRLAGRILEQFDVIWVRRGTPDRAALRQALRILESGGILGVAPEGTRSPSKRLMRGKPGAAFLALRADVPILPLGLVGTSSVLRAWRRLRRPRLRVIIGEPYILEPIGEQRRDLQALSDEMMLRIARLLPPDYHGVYADWEQPSTNASDSRQTPPRQPALAEEP
jgi:1-acyl-sn-glycerol-3-phosphate acyltransferase